MALTRVKTFTVPAASTTAIAVDASDVFGTDVPKLFLLFSNGQETDADARFTMLRCIGWGTGATTRGGVADISLDANGTAQSARHHTLTGVASEMTTTVGTITGVLDVQSFDAGGITFVPDDDYATARTFIVVLIGGDDWEQYAPIKISPTSTGDVDYTVTGFVADDPDQGGFIVSAGLLTDPPTSLGDTNWHFGCAYGHTPVNYVTFGANNDNPSTMQTTHFSREGVGFYALDAARTAADTAGAVTAWITDGVRVNWSSATSTTLDFFFIPFRCANFALFEFLTSTSTGALSSISGFGFTPTLAGCISSCMAENSGTTFGDHDRLSVGFIDGEGSLAAFATNDQDNTADSEVRCYLDADGSVGDIYNAITTAGKYAGASLALDSDGVTPTQTDADTGASFVWGFAVGEADAGAPSTFVPRRALMGVGF